MRNVISKGLILLLIYLFVFFSYLMLELTLPYLSFDNTIAFLSSKQDIIHIDYWRLSFYVHVFSSMFILITGFVQFFRASFQRYLKLHRLLGKIYVFLILFVSGPTGLIMAVFANGGIIPQAGFVTLAIAWMIFTYLAYRAIRQKNLKRHREMMIRSYALTLSAITLRSWVFLFSYYDLGYLYTFVLISWIALIPNWLVAEAIIYIKRRAAINQNDFARADK